MAKECADMRPTEAVLWAVDREDKPLAPTWAACRAAISPAWGVAAGGCQYYGVGGWMPLAKDVTPFQSREAAYAGSRGFGWSHRVQILPVDAAGNILSAPESVEPAGWVIEDTRPAQRKERYRGAGEFATVVNWAAKAAEVSTPWPSHADAKSFRARYFNWSHFRILPYAEALRLDAAEQAAAAERLAGAASEPAPTPKPPREVVGYRVRIAQSGTYGKLDDLEPGGWAQMNKPVTMTRADAVTLCRRVRKWIRDSNATEAGWAPTLHPVVRRKPRPDVAAAIAACEEGLEALTWVGGEGAAQSRECLITALAALRGQR